MADIVILKRVSGEYDALCFVDDDALWKCRFVTKEALLVGISSLPDVWDIELEGLKRFADRDLYPEHLAGAINSALVSEVDLRHAGFVRYVRAE